MYGSYESSQAIEMEDGGDVEFHLALTCVNPSRPARLYALPGDCYPAEAAEFELESVHIIDDDGKPVRISEEAWTARVGTDAAQKMIEAAEVAANESGDF